MTKQANTSDLPSLIAKVREQLAVEKSSRRKPRQKKFVYELSLITFLDVLGMRELLKRSGGNASQVAQVLDVFRSFTKHADDQKLLWQSQFVNFSDLALRVLPVLSEANVKYRLGAFFHEIWNLGIIQINLIDRGILVRGGVVLGDICVKDGLTFGPGLAEAYGLEQAAEYPRIVVSERAVRALDEKPVLRARDHSFQEEMSYLKGFLRRDEDGIWFLDYLALARTDCDDPPQYAALLSKHKELIEKQRVEIKAFQRGKQRTNRLRKLKWLIALHRKHMAEHNAAAFLEQTGQRLSRLSVAAWR